MDFGERKKKILSIIVEKYIEFGSPIGSKTVCKELDISVSSATVRNEMAELSELGYLNQPHTSAGRVPSYMGYKFYIHKLMMTRGLSEEEKSFINGELCLVAQEPERLLVKASEVLAQITGLASVFTTPEEYGARVKEIEFVKTGKRNAMLVLMTTTGIVKNRLFRCDYNITNELIGAFKRVCNDKFQGELLEDLNPDSMGVLSSYGNDMFTLMSPIFNVLAQASKDALRMQTKVAGEANLVTVSELEPSQILKVLEFLRDDREMIRVLTAREGGINVFIGSTDLCLGGLSGVSIVTARYKVGGRSGALGVIGPSRMDYRGVIDKMKYISCAVGAWLERILEIRD